MGKREIAGTLFSAVLGLGGLAVITALTLASEQPYRSALLLFGIFASLIGVGGLVVLFFASPPQAEPLPAATPPPMLMPTKLEGPRPHSATDRAASEPLRTLSNEFFQMRDQLAGVWVDRPMDSMPDLWRTIMSAMHRAGIEATSDLQNPSSPDQTGIVICVPDPDHPSETAKRLKEVFRKVGIDPSFDVISDRQRLRPDDAPSLVIYVAPPPL